MKNTKLKVLVVTLAVCLLAMGSLGTLAWFTAEDEVTNNFLIADSDDDADEIFSINVWEKDDEGNVYDDEGITYPDIQPGDDLYKEVNIENTGYYDQYVRATVTITGADVWFDVYDEVFFDLANFATDLNPAFTVDRVEFNLDTNEVIYTLYYNDVLKSGDVVNLFTNVHIAKAMDQYQAAELVDNNFNINVVATAVQTANVGDNAIEAFKTVEMYKEAGEYLVVTTATGAIRGIVAGILEGIPVDVSFDFTDDIDDVFTAEQIVNSGSLQILGGEVYASLNNKGSMDIFGSVVTDVTVTENFKGSIFNAGDMTISESTVKTNFVQTYGGSVAIDNSTLNSGTTADYAFIAASGAEVVIDNTVINAGGGAIGATGGSKVIFNGGKVYVDSESTSARYVVYAVGEGTEVVINGGDFSWDPNDNTKRAYVYADAGTTVTINGGTFGKASARSGYTTGILGSGTVVITGGTFGFNPSAWVDAANYAVNYDATAKKWTVVAK